MRSPHANTGGVHPAVDILIFSPDRVPLHGGTRVPVRYLGGSYPPACESEVNPMQVRSTDLVRLGMLAAFLSLSFVATTPAAAQYPPGKYFSPNVRLAGHAPLGAAGTVMDLEMEQDLSRPYVYVSRSDYGKATPK